MTSQYFISPFIRGTNVSMISLCDRSISPRLGKNTNYFANFKAFLSSISDLTRYSESSSS